MLFFFFVDCDVFFLGVYGYLMRVLCPSMKKILRWGVKIRALHDHGADYSVSVAG